MVTPRDTRVLETGAEHLGIALPTSALESFGRYQALLAEWNKRVNLTSVDDWDGVLRTHVLDSLTVAAALAPEILAAGRVVDVGSGAGFPGVPLKVVFPGLQLTLIEATGKKAVFLKHLVGELALHDVDVLHGRAEDLAHEPGHREGYDLALARALASMPALVELTLPFLRAGGSLVAQKKGAFCEELASARIAISEMGGRLERVDTIALPELAEPRSLVVVRKRRPTPERFPRRAGMPAKRPILTGEVGRDLRHGQAGTP